MADRKAVAGGRFWLRLLVAGIGCGGALAATATEARAQYVGRLSSFVVDARTGQVLEQTNPDLQRYPASLTKLMTLYLTFQALRDGRIALDQPVPVSAHAASMEPSKLGIVPGTYMTVEQGILALVTKSANDAACALGEMLGGGSEPRFAQIMTQQARLLGMTGTTFRNASGLPDPDQVSTARDFAVLARHLITDFPDQYHYFDVPAFMFHGRYIGNHDPMLEIYPGADGLKTGYTAEAGHNMVSSAQRGNVRLIGVVLGARSNPQRSAIMAGLLDQGFEQEGVPVLPHMVPHRLRGGVALVSDTTAGRGRHGRRGRHGHMHLAAVFGSVRHLLHRSHYMHPARHGVRIHRVLARGPFLHGPHGVRVQRALARGRHLLHLPLTRTAGLSDRGSDG